MKIHNDGIADLTSQFDPTITREGSYRYYMLGGRIIDQQSFSLGWFVENHLEPCSFLSALANELKPIVERHGSDMMIPFQNRIETFPPFRPHEPSDFLQWESPMLACRFYNESMTKAYGVIGYRFEDWKFTYSVTIPQPERWAAFASEAHPIIASWVASEARGKFETDPFGLNSR